MYLSGDGLTGLKVTLMPTGVGSLGPGPTIDSSSGMRMSPCKAPTTTMEKKFLKNTRNTSDEAKANGRVPRNVVKQPKATDGPISIMHSSAFLLRESDGSWMPKLCAMCAE